MSDVWLNYQYTIEFSNGLGNKSEGICAVSSITANTVRHGSASYMINPKNGDPTKHYVYGGSFTEPLNVSIFLGDGARPWLQWFSGIQSGKDASTRNVTISLLSYGQDSSDTSSGRLLLRWDLINCFPVSWQIHSMGVSDAPSPMQMDMTLQFDSMVISDGDDELSEVMG